MLYEWLRHIDFAYPFCFSLFILLPLMIWWYVKRNKQASFTVSTSESFKVITYKNRLRHFPFIFRLLALSCLIVALARPQRHHSETNEEGEGIDIVLCMDVSGSMGSRDILPSRMEAASKVIILLTDGKEDAPATRLIDPLTALEIAKSKGVKVYTIGMSAIVPRDIVTENVSRKKNAAGDHLDEELLRKIANETGGQYFRATNKDGLKRIYEQIDVLTKSRIEVTTFKRAEEKFLPFVLAALGLLFLEVLLRFTLLKKFP